MLTAREREVLGEVTEGRSNGIFTKLDMPPSDDDNRRVRAVLTYLNA